jgi:sodium transport system permease protein
MRASVAVFRKEFKDSLRDRRTLLMVFLGSVAVGPLMLWMVSWMVGSIEQRAEERVVLVAGAEHAPTLINHLQRQNLRIESAPSDHQTLIQRGDLAEAVIAVGADFEAQLASNQPTTLTLISNGSNNRSRAAANRAARALSAFVQEQASLRMLMRGVALPMVEGTVEIEAVDVAGRQLGAAQFANTIPFFVLMAVLYGALTAALDATAGERERGSLEPLLATPARRESIVIGKWAAVASVGMFVAVLSCLSFLPAQWLMRSESLAAMFQFGLPEAAAFIALLVPFAAAMAAVLMAVAIHGKTFKEAQATTTMVILVVTMLPMVQFLSQQAEARWHLWVPALGQSALMSRVLRGDSVNWVELLMPLGSSFLIAGACLAYVTHTLRHAATR